VHRHTLLVSKTISLAVGNEEGQPSTLHDCGYHVHAVERSVRVGDRTAVPDIMFLNEGAGHMLIVDCKGGPNIKPDQDGRYAEMRLEDILEAARPPCEVRSHTFAYAANEEHVDRMCKHTDFAIIAFGNRVVRAVGDLGHAPLTQELQLGVSLGETTAPPFYAYPFSINDDDGHVDSRVESAIQSFRRARPGARLLANRATADEVLRAARPFHEKFAPAHRAELVEVVRLSIARMLARRAPRWF